MSQAKQTTEKSSAAHPMSDKVKSKLHESVDALAEKAAETEESLRYRAEHGSQEFHEKQDELTSQWNNSPIKKYAVENPVATAGIAFAAGMLFSSFFKQK